MEFMGEYLKANEAALKFLANPIVPDANKKEIIAKIAKEAEFHQSTTNFMNLLVDKKRMNELEGILVDFELLALASTSTQMATVTSAVSLSEEQKAAIVEKIKGLTGAKDIKLKTDIDKSILGGFIVQYGENGSGLIDMSVKGEVESLSQMVA